MTERAAHLVDHVFPKVPVRQWVLSLPPRVRYMLAWDHTLCRAVVAVFARAVLGSLRHRARLAGTADGRAGGVAIVQRFGAALNLNVHVHALIMDGVFVADGAGGVRFRPARPMGDDELAALLATIERRILRLLARRGVAGGSEGFETPDRWSEDAPLLAGLAAASVRGVRALGPRAGAPVRRWGDPIDAPEPPPLGRWHARQHGFDLHAGVLVPAGARDRLERLCRYALRPPLAQDRLQLMPNGQAVLELRRRWTDGTTHLIFDPVELLERLAALIPRPRINLVLYHGVLAPRSAWRTRVVRSPKPGEDEGHSAAPGNEGSCDRGRRTNRAWADLMERIFPASAKATARARRSASREGGGFDVLACPRCSGRLTLVALIRAPEMIERILRHLHLPDAVPVMRPSRAPPLPLDGFDDGRGGDDD
jgi:hypothetical protein